MILSMTGFGSAERTEGGVHYRVEIRSVNNRYFKATIKLPELLQRFESDIEQQLRQRLGRGSVSYSLRIRDAAGSVMAEINVAALQSIVERLRGLRADGASVQIDLAALLALPGIVEPPDIDESMAAARQATIRAVTDEAIGRLIEMRRSEGAALRADLAGQCVRIRELVSRVRARSPLVVEDYHRKLRVRVNALLAQGGVELNQDDLVREIAIFAERCDVNEEIARLESHLEQFLQICDRGEEAGRKLDFLAQELLREANTIGSKANDAEIARLIVDTKATIDRIKEQVQNVA
ncbi:MAG: YicC family protein [Phycisphaerae bacterium]|nr:YicC family protein [Phycisphaerae bacterium]